MNIQASKQTKKQTEKQSFCALDRKGQSKKGIGKPQNGQGQKKEGKGNGHGNRNANGIKKQI